MAYSERQQYWEQQRIQQAENASFVEPAKRENPRCPVCGEELVFETIYLEDDEPVACSFCLEEYIEKRFKQIEALDYSARVGA